MIATFTVYADFKAGLHAGFGTVSPTFYYFDDTAGPTGNFFIYAIYWAGSDALQAVLSVKPNTFMTDFPSAVKLSSAVTLS